MEYHSLLREQLGELARIAWVKWAKTQDDPKETWLVPWEQLNEPTKEADRCLGMSIWGVFNDGLYTYTNQSFPDSLATDYLEEVLNVKRGEL